MSAQAGPSVQHAADVKPRARRAEAQPVCALTGRLPPRPPTLVASGRWLPVARCAESPSSRWTSQTILRRLVVLAKPLSVPDRFGGGARGLGRSDFAEEASGVAVGDAEDVTECFAGELHAVVAVLPVYLARTLQK